MSVLEETTIIKMLRKLKARGFAALLHKMNYRLKVWALVSLSGGIVRMRMWKTSVNNLLAGKGMVSKRHYNRTIVIKNYYDVSISIQEWQQTV